MISSPRGGLEHALEPRPPSLGGGQAAEGQAAERELAGAAGAALMDMDPGGAGYLESLE